MTNIVHVWLCWILVHHKRSFCDVLLDNAKIKYNTCGKEPIITANSSSLGCVGNVLLDIQGKHLTIYALVVANLSSNCLIAWKDMQRAGIISPSFPAKVHLTKLMLGVIPELTRSTTLCQVPKVTRVKEFTRSMPLCAVPDCTVPECSDRSRKCTVPKGSVESRKCTVPKCCVKSRKYVNVTDKSDSLVTSLNMVKRTVTASAVDQSKSSCLKQNLTDDTLDSLMKEFKDVFEADKITPLAGAPMQIHLRRDDPSYRPIRVSHHRKVPLHFQEEADKTLKWFLDSGLIVPVPPTITRVFCGKTK
jgi:hypothetical protein